MKFKKSEIPYLTGEKFSNGLVVDVSNPAEKQELTRMEYIEALVKGKKIIHLGCTDHIPLIKEKINNNIWFHKRLDDITERCLGVDINEESINYVKDELGYIDIINYDIMKDEPSSEILSEQWDYLIMGEILEHVENPTILLSKIKEKLGSSVKRIIITVPNAFGILNFKFALKHQELINTDHKFWFSPYTLGKIAMIAGFEVESFNFCFPGPLPRRKFFTSFLLKKFPVFRETLVMTLKS